MEDTFCLRTHFVVRIAATAFIYYHIIFDVSIYIFYPNRKYNFLKNRVRATSASAFAKGSAQTVFSLLR